MRHSLPPHGSARRGATTVEFALVVPLLVSVLMFSAFLTDILRARFKLLEASRYVAWEMSSFTLSDYGQARHDAAFDTAMQAVRKEATERYADLDSIEPEGHFGTLLSAAPVRVSIKNQPVEGIDLGRVFPGGDTVRGPEVGVAVGRPLRFFLEQFRFNTRGQVEVELSSTLTSTLLPQHLFQKEEGGLFSVDNWGGRDLSRLPITHRYTLIANGWHLPDGGDALMKPKKAGVHDGGSEHGISLQVDRMKFLGVGDYLHKAGLDKLGSVAHFLLPDFLGPFVVSHNYLPGEGGRGCNRPKHGAALGLNNLNAYPGMDDPAQRCFDTAPFRDTQAYDSSLYRKMFMARGDHFMGCKHAQADMPNLPGADPSTATDKNQQRVTCE